MYKCQFNLFFANQFLQSCCDISL